MVEAVDVGRCVDAHLLQALDQIRRDALAFLQLAELTLPQGEPRDLRLEVGQQLLAGVPLRIKRLEEVHLRHDVALPVRHGVLVRLLQVCHISFQLVVDLLGVLDIVFVEVLQRVVPRLLSLVIFLIRVDALLGAGLKCFPGLLPVLPLGLHADLVGVVDLIRGQRAVLRRCRRGSLALYLLGLLSLEVFDLQRGVDPCLRALLEPLPDAGPVGDLLLGRPVGQLAPVAVVLIRGAVDVTVVICY